MELRYLRYFVAVAERRSFSRASEDLHVAQSAVSQQIKMKTSGIGSSLCASSIISQRVRDMSPATA